MNHVTTQKYVDIFEKLFLIRTLEPWYTNELKRLVKTPKLHFLDSGLLAAMRNLSPARLQANRTPFGSLLETFVLSELLKLASWSGEQFEFFHFRDRYDNEVDIVIEDQDGQWSASRSRLRPPSEVMISPAYASLPKPAANDSYWGS